MDNTTLVLLKVIAVALMGWLATTHWLKTRTSLRPQIKRMLIVPLWFPWMILALGGPVVQGVISLSDAVSAGGGFTAGMLFYLALTARQRRRSRQ